nr:hypothetical protein Iba_scaffold6333CG0220 [Ipomoea batatas]GME10081.1 hypothetical protein Iba_scaffold9471CG0050 [Ipomoea batatas]GME10667.1 hypothetical protein Iba_scaffold10421CG0010 [Ipomoea batatas]
MTVEIPELCPVKFFSQQMIQQQLYAETNLNLISGKENREISRTEKYQTSVHEVPGNAKEGADDGHSGNYVFLVPTVQEVFELRPKTSSSIAAAASAHLLIRFPLRLGCCNRSRFV